MNIEVKSGKIVDSLTICGLKLERILGTLTN